MKKIIFNSIVGLFLMSGIGSANARDTTPNYNCYETEVDDDGNCSTGMYACGNCCESDPCETVVIYEYEEEDESGYSNNEHTNNRDGHNSGNGSFSPSEAEGDTNDNEGTDSTGLNEDDSSDYSECVVRFAELGYSEEDVSAICMSYQICMGKAENRAEQQACIDDIECPSSSEEVDTSGGPSITQGGVEGNNGRSTTFVSWSMSTKNLIGSTILFKNLTTSGYVFTAANPDSMNNMSAEVFVGNPGAVEISEDFSVGLGFFHGCQFLTPGSWAPSELKSSFGVNAGPAVVGTF